MKSKTKFFLIGTLLTAFFAVIILRVPYQIQDQEMPQHRNNVDNNQVVELKNQIQLLNQELLSMKNKKSASMPLNSDIDDIHAKLNALQDQFNALNKESNVEDIDRTEGVVSIEEQMAHEQQRTDEIVNFLNEQFTNQSADPVDWNQSVQEQLNQMYVKNNMASDPVIHQSNIQHFDCQTALCRVEVQHENQIAEQSFMMSVSQLNAFQNGEAFSQRVEAADGSIKTVSFISRDGQRLPEFQTQVSGL